MLQKASVVALVNEETSFLTFQPIDMELQAILKSHVILASANQEAVFLIQVGLERKRRLALVVNILNLAVHHIHDSLGYLLSAHMHSNGMSLHNDGASVAVDNQSRQIVAFAMNHSICCVVGSASHTDASAHIVGNLQATLPEVEVYLLIVERKHADSDAANLPMTYGDELSIVVKNPHN